MVSRRLLGISKGGDLHNFPGQPAPMLGHHHSKKVFPDVQEEPPVFQPVPIAFGVVTEQHWKEPGSVPSTLSLQVVIYLSKTVPVPALPQAEQFQVSHPFLICEMLQYLNHLHGPSLDNIM